LAQPFGQHQAPHQVSFRKQYGEFIIFHPYRNIAAPAGDTEDFSDTADSYTVGAMVQLNLFSGNGISAKTKAAKSDLKKVNTMYTVLTQGVEVQTREAYLSAQSAWQRISVAEHAVTQSEEGLRIVMNRYQSGLLTIVDLLDAQVADQQARTLHFKALHDYKVARIKLAAAAGIIDPNFQ
jgi:outer membrane protein TolC